MSNHYTHARAPAEADRIQAYLTQIVIPPEKPWTTKALLECVFEKGEERDWAKRNIGTIAKYLDGYYLRGAPFKFMGKTCRSYLWHSLVEPDPELDPQALEIRVNQIQTSLDLMREVMYSIEERIDRIEAKLDATHNDKGLDILMTRGVRMLDGEVLPKLDDLETKLDRLREVLQQMNHWERTRHIWDNDE